MKIAILGTGLMGKEVAKDLIRSSKVKFIGLADIDFAKAEQVCKQIDSEKIKPFQVRRK